MTYQPGSLTVMTAAESQELRALVQADDFGDRYDELTDRLGFHAQFMGAEHPGAVAYLPHSCDEWIVGGPEDVRALIADLQAALDRMERTDALLKLANLIGPEIEGLTGDDIAKLR